MRYFGGTMSVDTDEVWANHLPDHFTDPVQFSPGKTLHAVSENEECDSLTSVIATQEGKEQGGFDLDDHRIQYGLIGFHGLVDEHGASDTKLTHGDVERLDTLCWRAIKNQTISRSKVGQEPRLYCRVGYADESFHLGGLNKDISLASAADTDRSVVAFHNPPGWVLGREIAEYVSTYEPRFFDDLEYITDSNQRWRDDLSALEDFASTFQLLVHPILSGESDADTVQRISAEREHISETIDRHMAAENELDHAHREQR